MHCMEGRSRAALNIVAEVKHRYEAKIEKLAIIEPLPQKERTCSNRWHYTTRLSDNEPAARPLESGGKADSQDINKAPPFHITMYHKAEVEGIT